MISSSRYAPDGRAWLFVADVLMLVGCTLLSLSLHRPLGIAPELGDSAISAHVLLLVTFDVLAVLRLGLAHQYDQGRHFARIDDAFGVARALFVATAIATLMAVVGSGSGFEVASYSRSFLAFALGLPFVGLVALRFVACQRQRAAFRQGRYLARLLVVGDGERAAGFVGRLTSDPSIGYQGINSAVSLDLPLAEYMQSFSAELESVEPDEVVLALEHPRAELRAAIAREVAYRNLSVRVLADVFEEYYELPVCRYDGMPVTTIFQTPGDRFARRLKRVADTVLAAVGLVVLAPFLSIVALLIWLEDRGPVLFAQERVGERGKRFMVLKFRTMRVDAEARMAELRQYNEADGPIFKMRDDPRVTRVGKWLRRFSIDEFPQLLNVVRSQMSLVGPRPPIPAEVDEYRVEHRRRLMVQPGMTGLWQVSGRSDTTFDEMVNLDLAYISSWSPWLDARIMLRTAWVVLFARGAY
jgi:exopolysaccharide biosynthesis polyprenyl glycosylphosphotransferase